MRGQAFTFPAPPRRPAGPKSSQACCELRIQSEHARAAAGVAMEAVTWAVTSAGFEVAFLAMGNEAAREIYGDKVDTPVLRERYGVVEANLPDTGEPSLRAGLRAIDGVLAVSYFLPHPVLWRDKLHR